MDSEPIANYWRSGTSVPDEALDIEVTNGTQPATPINHRFRSGPLLTRAQQTYGQPEFTNQQNHSPAGNEANTK